MAISLIATVSTDAGSGNVSITHGLTISSGDVIIASIHANGAGTTATDNNGSTPFTEATASNTPTSSRYTIAYRVCGASEPSSYAWTLSASNRWSVVLRQYRGVDSSVWDVAPAAGNLTTGNFVATAVSASITIATSGACGLVFSCDDNTPTTTTFTSVNNSYANAKSESGQQYQATADRLGLSTGTLSATTITSSGNVTYAMWQCALKPAAATAKAIPIFKKHTKVLVRR